MVYSVEDRILIENLYKFKNYGSVTKSLVVTY